ncbi:M48 family metalloprotease, partial [Paraburkholderia sp. SIMBA_030]
FFRSLTATEKAAVMAHETGHIRNYDTLRRLWWFLTLRVFWDFEWVCARCREQELAADAYVKEQGLAHGMRSFLCRHPQPR